MLNVFIYLLFGILIITSVLLVLIVLMQRPKNEGLGASFGGGMTQDLFGAQTTNVLQKFTVYLGALFFGSCLLLTILYSKSSTRRSQIQEKLAAVAQVKKIAPTPISVASPSATPSATAAPTPMMTPAAAATPEQSAATPTPAPVVPEVVATPAPSPAATTP